MNRSLVSLVRGVGFVSTWFALVATLAATAAARAQQSSLYGESSYNHQLCLPPCACPQTGIEGRLDGTYTLTFVTIGDVFDFYTIDNAQFFVRTPTGNVTLLGSGTYQQSTIIGQQHMRLDLVSSNAIAPIVLESGPVPLVVDLPAISIDLSNFDIVCQSFALRFVGGPAFACPVDFDDGEGLGIHDNAVDVNDLLYFLDKFEAGDVAIDLVGGPCGCVDCVCPDGAVGIDDLLFFLRRFEAGC